MQDILQNTFLFQCLSIVGFHFCLPYVCEIWGYMAVYEWNQSSHTYWKMYLLQLFNMSSFLN